MKLSPSRTMIAICLIALVLLWAWGNRTGRYQVAPTGAGFVVLDTATGIHWVYEQRWLSSPDTRNFVFRMSDTDSGIPFLSRVVPPSE